MGSLGRYIYCKRRASSSNSGERAATGGQSVGSAFHSPKSQVEAVRERERASIARESSRRKFSSQIYDLSRGFIAQLIDFPSSSMTFKVLVEQ